MTTGASDDHDSLSSADNEETCSNIKQAYKPPAHKKLEDILKLDNDDESLQKYKQSLIPDRLIILRSNDLRNVIPIKLSLIFEDIVNHSPFEFNIDGQSEDVAKRYANVVITIKQNVNYYFKLDYYVQRDIVTGLQYCVKMKSQSKLFTTTSKYMIGSRAPCKDHYTYNSTIEQIPSGMLARGKYTVKNVLKDDYGQEFLKWKWVIKMASEWEDSIAL
ncbi:hypothetical protein GJ496_011052 [Pomphorhynchus laevis]|nr:hypothetical protein GJ496_011052 [Pomphorhynchus laevis]